VRVSLDAFSGQTFAGVIKTIWLCDPDQHDGGNGISGRNNNTGRHSEEVPVGDEWGR